MKLDLDPNDLTIGDMEDFEDVTGSRLDELLGTRNGDGVKFTAKQLVAFVWIVTRKSNPAFTLDDARATKITDLEVNLEPRPTQAAGSLS